MVGRRLVSSLHDTKEANAKAKTVATEAIMAPMTGMAAAIERV